MRENDFECFASTGVNTPLLAMLDHAVEERFLKPQNRGLALARESAAELLRVLEEWRPARVEKWLDRETR
jgi:predicted Rossmann-fold nucleotide-binding protein